MARRSILLALLLAAIGSGCAPEDPYSPDRARQRDGARFEERLRSEQARGDELAPPAAEADSAPAYAASRASLEPERVLRAFCAQWANWSYRTIDRQQRRLAELSTPALAGELAPGASQRALDSTLKRDRFAVRGEVVATDLRAGDDRRSAVCVTREEELDNGRDPLGDGAHRVYFARLLRTGARWTIGAWQPQP